MAEQALQVQSFEGGMTDNYIGGQPNQFETAQNMVIRPDKKIASRPGATILNASYYQVPYAVSPKRVDSIIRFKDTDIYQTQNKLYHIGNLGFSEIVGATGNAAFPTTAVEFDQCSAAEWNNHLIVTNDDRTRPVVIYKDGTNFKLFTLGLPTVNTASITMSAAGAEDRGYCFCWAYTYTIDGVEFTQRGPVSAPIQYTGTIPNSIAGLPTITNTSSDNYDTAVLKLEVYRTAHTQDLFYKTGEVTNGTTTLNDTTVDADLDAGLVLYTDAEDLDYHQPPKCKFVIQNNSCMYYLNIEDSRGDIFPNRIVQAAPDQPYAANEGNIIDVDQAITGGGVAGQNAIVFTEDRVYRLDGIYFSDGSGGIQKVEISRTVGCISHKSIVQTLEGCFFAARDGFYFTNGYNVIRISEQIPTTYAECVDEEEKRKRIYGCYDSFNKRVYWAATSGVDQTDNNVIFVAHLYWGVHPSVPFTVFDGGYWASNYAPTALAFYDDKLVYGHSSGYLMQHLDGSLNDAKIDTSVAPASWKIIPVIWDFRWIATDFGDITSKKFVTKMTLDADAIAKATIAIYSISDNTGVENELKEIQSNSPVQWGDTPVPLWADTTLRWDYVPLITGMRRFPGNELRCSYKQLRFTNSYTLIDDSDGGGTVTVDAVAKTVTLDTAGIEWLNDPEEYYISFSTDAYESEYKITNRNSTTVLAIDDSTGLLASGSGVSYKVYGYRKNEAIRLLGFSIIFSTIGATQAPYRAS